MIFDKRTFYIFMVIMIMIGFKDRLNNPESILELLLTIPGLLIAITFHEFAHAFAADKLGDDTPRSQGRLSLNPIIHMDPIGTVMLLFAGFGWGKPVQVNPRNYDRRMSMDKADAIVSIAGPLMNFILAIIFTIIYCALYRFIGIELITTNITVKIIITMISGIIAINIGLGVFNLIPLPPLDGSKIIKPFLSFRIRNWFENNEQMIQIVFIFLWIFNVLSMVITPIIDYIYYGLIKFGMMIFGI